MLCDSIGVILYILLSAMPPYNPQLSNAELARRSIKFPRPAFDNVSDLAKDLILKVWRILCLPMSVPCCRRRCDAYSRF